MFAKIPRNFSKSLIRSTLKRFSSEARFPEIEFFNNCNTNKLQFEYDHYKPTHSFLIKSMNNPNEPIVFLHDILSTKNSMAVEANDICKTLETDVYALNFRNYCNKYDGIDSKDELHQFQKFNEETLVNDITEFCNEMRLNNVILVGEGYGGKIAMLAALNAKLNISKLVCIESLPQDLPEKAVTELNTWIDALLYIINDSSITKTDKLYLEKCYKIMNSDKFEIHDFKTIQYLLKNISKKRINREVLSNYPYLEPKIPLHYIKDNIIPEYSKWNLSENRFTNPSLFIMGRNSNYFSAKQINDSLQIQKNLDKYFPDNKLRIFNSNHFVLDNQSTNVSNAICQFLLYAYNPQYDELRKQDGLIS